MTKEGAISIVQSRYPCMKSGVVLTENEMVELVMLGYNSRTTLPAGLDEAAEKNSKEYYCSALKGINETGICDGCENVKLAFKAGAEWTADTGGTQ